MAIHQLIAYWTLAAYPVLVILTYIYYLVRRLRGWSRLSEATARPQPIPDANRQDLYLNLTTKGPKALMYHVLFDVECRVRDPLGQEHVTAEHGLQLFRGTFHAGYPHGFDQAPAVVPGTYTVTWVERRPPGSGKWRVMHRARLDVPAYIPAVAS